MQGYLLIHGLENHRPEGHWMRNLAMRLRKQGLYVAYPQLPNPDQPVAADWLEVLGTEIELMKDAGVDSLVVIAHSMGCVTWMMYSKQHEVPITVKRVLLVAPADPKMLKIAPTFQIPIDEELKQKMNNACPNIFILASDKDPWIPEGVMKTFGEPLEIKPVIWQGAGHISMDEGFGDWDGVVYWALDPNNDLLIR
ncbi:MAG: hypothetical protein RLZZ330_283 [Actinomycetota bacterium]|jgi:predicted alpha/beta hydrolase family esterase